MENTKNDPLLGKTILGKYLIIKKIGEGSFGKIYKAESDNQYYALKVEKKRKGHSLLKKEAETMKLIQGSKIINSLNIFF
jgi:serine/threonine protein kinase